MKVEDYIRMYNEFAHWTGMQPIQRADGPYEKGKNYKEVKINTFPFLLQ